MGEVRGPFTRSRENDPQPVYRGKVCLTDELTLTGLGLITSAGWKPSQLVEVETLLPSGRPAILRFSGGERGMWIRVFVPPAHLVACDPHLPLTESADDP